MNQEQGPTREKNLCNLISEPNAQALALRNRHENMSYGQMRQAVGQARQWLEEYGVEPHDRVALSLPNIPQMPILYFAILSLGAVVVPLNPLLSAQEVNYHMDDSQASLLVIWEGSRVTKELPQLKTANFSLAVLAAEGKTFAPSNESSHPWQVTAVEAEDPAVLLYTSGTTGKPKGAVLTHANLLSNARTVASSFEYSPQDVFFGGLPLFHAFGQTVSMNAVFAAGASIALLARFTPEEAAELCEETGVTVLAAVPSMYSALAAYFETRDVSSLYGKLSYGISGGSALPSSIHSAFDRLISCPIYEGYGLSETSPVVSFNQKKFGLTVGSVGRALPGIEVQVRDRDKQILPAEEVGQLWVKGPNVMACYWNNPQATAEVMDGQWFATGDLARIDEAGNIFIVDRIKDMILRNGYSVYPREIEDVLYQHRGVRLVAVVGIAHEKVGEEIYAAVVPQRNLSLTEQNTLIEELNSLARQNLAAYKYPRQYRILNQLPLGPTGKILKDQIRSDQI